MGRSEYDDEDDRGSAKHRGNKRPRRFEHEDDDNGHKQKRSGKRFHRRNSLKDENWPDDNTRSSPKRK